MSLSRGKILSATELERYRVRAERNLPAKGKKEFAPTFSWVECKLLDAGRDERHALLKEERVERVGTLSVAEWNEKANIAIVTYTVGRNWEFFGHQRGETKCLHPEEALFLLETSNLLLLHNNVGLSIQQGYNTLLGKRTGCSLACYRVFSHLARQGYRLRRHEGPLYVLTDYERRIGLESYLYPGKHTTGNLQNLNNNDSLQSGAADYHQNSEGSMTYHTINSEEVSAAVKSENAEAITGIKRENVVFSSVSNPELIVPIRNVSDNGSVLCVREEEATVTVKTENTEILSVPEAELQPDSSETSSNVFARNLRREERSNTKNSIQEHQLHGTVPATLEKSHRHLVTDIKKEHEDGEQVVESDIDVLRAEKKQFSELTDKHEATNIKREGNICEIKCERTIRTSASESTITNVNNCSLSTVNVVVNNCDSDINTIVAIKTECNMEKDVNFEDNSSLLNVSVEGNTENEIKKEVFNKSTDSCETVGSVEGSQHSNENCDVRMKERQYLKESLVASVSNDTVKHEGVERSVPSTSTHSCTPIVDLTNFSNTTLDTSQRKMQSYSATIVIDDCSRNMNTKTVNVGESSHNSILKCEIDSSDFSTVHDSSDVSIDISNSVDSEIVCMAHKGRKRRKRPISKKKTKKAHVVDVETDVVVHPNKNFVSKKITKQDQNKEIDEIILIDDSDEVNDDGNDILIDDSDSNSRNETVVVVKDEELEKELSKFYEEITLIDLTNEDTRSETRNEILDLFPNFAGVRIATVKAPPSNLLPENVAPSQQEYRIELRNLCANRPHWPSRKYFNRGRDTHHRFKFRGRPFRRPHYRRSPQNHIPDDRMYSRQQNNSEQFSNHYGPDHEGPTASRSYGNTFDSQFQDHVPLAMIDTTGAYIPTLRFEYQHRSPSGAPNKQWYGRTSLPNTRSESFLPRSNSPSSSSLHYENLIDNSYRERTDNYQRWNRRYNRNTNNRGNHSGRSKFTNSYGDSPDRSATFHQHTLENDWQKFQNVSPNVESWSDLKMMISGKNLQNGLIKRDCDTPIKSEQEESDEPEFLEEEREEETEVEEVEWKPLIEPNDCVDIGSILSKLRIFKEVHCDPHQIASVDIRLRINYDIYLPSTKFKKSAPCLPDYRLCVTESEDEVPTASEVSVLLKELQDDVPLLFAIVVPDSIAFYHFAKISLPVDDTFSI